MYDEYEEEYLSKKLSSMPLFLRKFCDENRDLAVSTRINYVQDFEYFFGWLCTQNKGICRNITKFDLKYINNLSEKQLYQFIIYLKNDNNKSLHRKVYALRSIFKYLLFTEDERGEYLLKNNKLLKVLSVKRERNRVNCYC